MGFTVIFIVCFLVTFLLGASVLNRMRIDARSDESSNYMGYDEDEIPVVGTYFIVFLITIVGLGGAIWGSYHLCSTTKAMTVGERYEASVVSYNSHKMYDSDKKRNVTKSYPIVEFTTKNGKTVTYSLKTASRSESRVVVDILFIMMNQMTM